MARPLRLIVPAAVLLAIAPASAGDSAKDAWKKLTLRYPVLQDDIDIVRSCPDVLGAALQGFVKSHPRSARAAKALYLLGRYHMSRREMSLARNAFWRCIEQFPQTRYADRSAHMIVGMYGAVGLWDGAHKQVTKLGKLLPKPRLMEELKRRLYAMEHTQKGKPPIPFQASDLDGRALSLAQFKGRPVLLIFWASTDPNCQTEVPVVRNDVEPFERKGLAVVSVSLDRDQPALRAFMQKHKIAWPTHFDGKGRQNAIARKYDVTSLPDLYMIDERGLLRFTNTRRGLVPERLQKLFDHDYEEVEEDDEP